MPRHRSSAELPDAEIPHPAAGATEIPRPRASGDPAPTGAPTAAHARPDRPAAATEPPTRRSRHHAEPAAPRRHRLPEPVAEEVVAEEVVPAPRRARHELTAAPDATGRPAVPSRHARPDPEPSGTGATATEPAATDPAVTDPTATDPTVPARHRHQAAGPGRRRAATERRTGRRADRVTRPARAGGRRKTVLVLLATAVGLVALPTVGSAAVDQCRWQVAAHELLVSLNGQSDQRSAALRRALKRAGVGDDVPAECTGKDGTDTGDSTATGSGGNDKSNNGDPSSGKSTSGDSTSGQSTSGQSTSGTSTRAPAPVPTPAPTGASTGTGTGTTAAAKFGWGTPVKSDDFTSGLSQWSLYDGEGHAGNGRRTPSAVSTTNGLLTIAGDAAGNTDGMSWGDGQKYGRWEARVKSPAADEDYHSVLLLWPDAENFPSGGEVDFMEIGDPGRQSVDTFLHYSSSNRQVEGNVKVDATQWHNWAVEWTPDHITTYLDGKQWWTTTNTSILPPGPMHMTIQLDNFKGSGLKPSQMQVDWARQYKL